MESIKGFRVLSLPLSKAGDVKHYIYVKEHVEKSQKGGALFVGNIDYRLDLSHEDLDQLLRSIFERFGDIESIAISESDGNGDRLSRFAHVNFAKKSSCKLALAASKEDLETVLKDKAKSLGVYRVPKLFNDEQIRQSFQWTNCNVTELKEKVDTYMDDFDRQEQQKKHFEADQEGKVDDDGFVTVRSRSNKRKSTDETAIVTSSEQNFSKRKRKTQTSELKNFYRFQIREEKMKQLDHLRRKFDDDKAKVARMKANRNFKPF